MEESALINQAKKGDLDAFNRLVLEYQDQAFNLALRMLGDQPSAEDAVQLTFISAYENLRSFRGGSFRAWILRITSNNCLDELRRQKRKPTVDLVPEDPETGEELESPEWLADEAMSPEEKVSQKELESVIQRCIQELPDEFAQWWCWWMYRGWITRKLPKWSGRRWAPSAAAWHAPGSACRNACAARGNYCRRNIV